ncbi:MAG: saccharopine dehydrogenase C-terminal domain-containing protein [Cyclonatronaceae bacterium]
MKIAIIGAGAVGTALTKLFCNDDSTSSVILIDRNGSILNATSAGLSDCTKLRTHRLGMENRAAVKSLIKGFDCLVSALPHKNNFELAQLALEARIHYIDFGADDKILEKQMDLHDQASTEGIWLIPNAGLAPGLLNILVLKAFEQFETVRKIHIRAAGLPVHPEPPLNYYKSFSVQGLLCEYLNPSYVIENGNAVYTESLEGYERMTFSTRPEIGEMEAFYTSGQSSSLVRHLDGRVNELNFKTLRYPGHRDIMKTVFNLGLASNQIIDVRTNLTYRELLVRQLQKYLPQNVEDVVLAKVILEGVKESRHVQLEYEIVHSYDHENNMSAQMACTAIPALLIARQLSGNLLPATGGAKPPELVIDKNRFFEDIRATGISIHKTEFEL